LTLFDAVCVDDNSALGCLVKYLGQTHDRDRANCTSHVVSDINTVHRLLSLGWTNPMYRSLRIIVARLRRPLLGNPMCVVGRNIPVLSGSEMSVMEKRFRRGQHWTVGSCPLCRQ
jgi:hypothetical protein